MKEYAIVSDKGQITIPSKIRKALNIEEGTQLAVTDTNGGVYLYPISKTNDISEFFGVIKPKLDKSADPDVAINESKLIKSREGK